MTIIIIYKTLWLKRVWIIITIEHSTLSFSCPRNITEHDIYPYNRCGRLCANVKQMKDYWTIEKAKMFLLVYLKNNIYFWYQITSYVPNKSTCLIIIICQTLSSPKKNIFGSISYRTKTWFGGIGDPIFLATIKFVQGHPLLYK